MFNYSSTNTSPIPSPPPAGKDDRRKRWWGRRIRSREPESIAKVLAMSSLYTLRDAPAEKAGRQRRSHSELTTTETEDSAIAAPASVGVRKPKAASGIPTTL